MYVITPFSSEVWNCSELPSKLCQVNWTSALEFVVFRLEMPNEKTPSKNAGLIVVFIDFKSISVVIGLVRAFFGYTDIVGLFIR